jgi:hypothetical protein
MNLDQPQGQGRVVPQATSGGGGFMSKLGAMVSGAFTQTLRSQNQLSMEYQREIIRSAGDKTRKDNTREFQTETLNDLKRRRDGGEGIEQAFGVRYTSGYKGKPEPTGDTPGTPPKKPKGTGKRTKGGSIAATVSAVKSGNIDFEQATGGEFGTESGISPKLGADFGAHVTAGGNQESYLNQFTPSGRRKRTKPDKPNTPPPPPPPPPGGGARAKKTKPNPGDPTGNATVMTDSKGVSVVRKSRAKKADPYKEDPDLAKANQQVFFK